MTVSEKSSKLKVDIIWYWHHRDVNSLPLLLANRTRPAPKKEKAKKRQKHKVRVHRFFL